MKRNFIVVPHLPEILRVDADNTVGALLQITIKHWHGKYRRMGALILFLTSVVEKDRALIRFHRISP